MDFQKYIFNKPKPLQPTKPVLTGKTAQDHRNYADLLEAYEGAMIIFKKQLGAWYEAKDHLNQQFKYDLLNELGILRHPKADKIFQMAWDKCHDEEGLEAVYDYASELVELVK